MHIFRHFFEVKMHIFHENGMKKPGSFTTSALLMLVVSIIRIRNRDYNYYCCGL
jgi:hypothetical protein